MLFANMIERDKANYAALPQANFGLYKGYQTPNFNSRLPIKTQAYYKPGLIT